MMATMKKTRGRAGWALVMTGWLVLLAALAASIIFGPNIVGMVRASQEIEQIARDDARNGGPWPRASDACIACHGFEGNARAQNYPRLAGQQEAYIARQLRTFASGARRDPTMTPLALSMGEPELQSLAAHFARMKPVPNDTFKADPTAASRGEALTRTGNCASCHGRQFEGKGEFPRLAGQNAGYLRDQLARFKDGTRSDPVMKAIAASLTEAQIDDLAQYLAGR